MYKKITIIGGAGFVGTNLCKVLSKAGQDFEIIDLKKSNLFSNKGKIGDVRDIESLRKNVTGDLIVNLAAIHRDDVKNTEEYHVTNVDGAANVAKICVEKNIRKIIFTSSVAVYGFCTAPTDETGPIAPFNEYGRTKFQAEEILRDWQVGTNSSLVIVRPTVIFGEGNRGNVFNLFKQIKKGRFLMIGNGENRKSIAYVGNFVAFLESCIRNEKALSVFNYVDEPAISMNEIVTLTRKVLRVRITLD